jgi:hypothetical protein
MDISLTFAVGVWSLALVVFKGKVQRSAGSARCSHSTLSRVREKTRFSRQQWRANRCTRRRCHRLWSTKGACFWALVGINLAGYPAVEACRPHISRVEVDIGAPPHPWRRVPRCPWLAQALSSAVETAERPGRVQ